MQGSASRELAELAGDGDDEGVTACIVAGRDAANGFLEVPDSEGRTALQNACAAGHESVVIKLLLAGADHTVTTCDGLNLLHLVARGTGSISVTDRLLHAAPGLKTAKCNMGHTPLLHASKHGNWDMCDMLDGRRINVASPEDTLRISWIAHPKAKSKPQDEFDAKIQRLRAEAKARVQAGGEPDRCGAKDNVYRLDETTGTIMGGLTPE